MQTAIKQRPILFSTEMVKAILEGRKCMTRRKLKIQPDPPRAIYSESDAIPILKENGDNLLLRFNWKTEKYFPKIFTEASFFEGKCHCPYGKIGDALWVRETFVRGCEWDGESPMPPAKYWYRADGDCPGEWHNEKKGEPGNIPWKPSIFMPYHACRLFLRITDIRVERLHDISKADAIAEGIESWNTASHFKNYSIKEEDNEGYGYFTDPIQSFRTLWKSINGPESWEQNPFVWVVSFERIDKP